MNRLCGICSQQVGRKKPGIECSGFCAKFFHGQCLNLSSGQLDALRSDGVSWRCLSCRSVDGDRRQSLGIATSRPSFTGSQSTGSPAASSAGAAQLSQMLSSDVMTLLQALRDDVQQMKTELRGLQDSVSFCSSKVTEFEANLNKMNEYFRKVDRLAVENAQLKSNVETLTSKMNDLDQNSRMKNIEIHGIPEKKGENLIREIQKVCSELDIQIDQNDIEFIHRVPSNPRFTPNEKSKNIIMGCSSRSTRDNILAAFKQKRLQSDKTSTSLSVDGVSDKIFINEHLTLANKLLHKESRDAAKKKGYKFVWVKNGHIFVRKNESSAIINIKNLEMIYKL